MKLPPPLRFSVPAVLFLLGCALSLGSIGYERNLADKHLEGLIFRHVQFIGNQISALASYFLAQGDLAGLKKQVSAVGADPILRHAMVCDDQQSVLVSSTYANAGRPLASTPLSYIGERLTPNVQAGATLSSDGKTIVGIFPFLLPPEPGELLSSRHGYLLLEYDLSHPKKQVRKALFERWVAITTALATVCILTWLFFHWALNKRISRLVAATEKLASGDFSATVQLKGSDEVARLAIAFNAMAQTLSSNTAELKETNRRMQQEITERKFIEEAMRNSERRFRSVWENSHDAMRLTDSKGTILAVNPAFCRLMGMPAEELLEMPFTAAHQVKDQSASLQKYRQRFTERSFAPHQLKKVKLHDGRMVDLEVSTSLIELDRPLVLSIFRDVTERVATLERLQEAKEFSENLINTANVMIVGLDEQQRITIFNETAQKVSGFSREEVQGKFWLELVRGTEPELNGENPSSPERNGRLARTFDSKLLSRGGDERIVSWQTNPIHQSGILTGTICFGIDITEKKKQEEQRLALERKLLDSQKLESLGVLAGGIAHDFNNLLTAILGNASLAAMQVEANGRARSYLANIEKTSMRAAELCKQMLAYSGKGRFAIQYLDLNEVVRETVELLEVSISKKAALRIELRPGLPGVSADPAQIRQVLMNLVINASEAIGDKTGVIRIKTGVIKADAAYLAQTNSTGELTEGEYGFVEVCDSGCGMSAETQARIFDPFFTTKFTGRGLGLAAVLGIVRGHKGALKIQSEIGKGSTFRFLLPLAKVMHQPVVNRTGNSGMTWRGEGTILIVDDDPTVRAVTARMVEAAGFDVLQAVDGRHGVQVFTEKHDRIRAVVLDLTMPNLNGQEAFEEMRRIDPQVKVLMVSGFSEDVRKGVGTDGLSGFLQKPFRPEDLNAKLRAMIS